MRWLAPRANAGFLFTDLLDDPALFSARFMLARSDFLQDMAASEVLFQPVRMKIPRKGKKTNARNYLTKLTAKFSYSHDVGDIRIGITIERSCRLRPRGRSSRALGPICEQVHSRRTPVSAHMHNPSIMFSQPSAASPTHAQHSMPVTAVTTGSVSEDLRNATGQPQIFSPNDDHIRRRMRREYMLSVCSPHENMVSTIRNSVDELPNAMTWWAPDFLPNECDASAGTFSGHRTESLGDDHVRDADYPGQSISL